MLIQVMYNDGRFDFVKPFILDRLLDEKKLDRFKRKSGWVLIGVDPLRGEVVKKYSGSDRRKHEILTQSKK